MCDTAHSVSLRQFLQVQVYKPLEAFWRNIRRSNRQARRGLRSGQRCAGLVSAGFASRKFLTWLLISRQVASSVYVGEKVSDFTQALRSAAGNVDQFLFKLSRVRSSP